MNDIRNNKRNAAKVFIAVILIIVLVAVGFILALQPDNKESQRTDGHTIKTKNTTTSPDRVKESGGPNNDTTSSPSGKGPGSDNSLLSQ